MADDAEASPPKMNFTFCRGSELLTGGDFFAAGHTLPVTVSATVSAVWRLSGAVSDTAEHIVRNPAFAFHPARDTEFPGLSLIQVIDAGVKEHLVLPSALNRLTMGFHSVKPFRFGERLSASSIRVPSIFGAGDAPLLRQGQKENRMSRRTVNGAALFMRAGASFDSRLMMSAVCLSGLCLGIFLLQVCVAVFEIQFERNERGAFQFLGRAFSEFPRHGRGVSAPEC